jgi:hypothetical protein
MQMETNDSINYQFNIGKGLGSILFDMSEGDFINILNNANDIDVDIYEEGIEETKRFHYKDLGVMISISMYGGEFEPVKIFSKKLIISNVDLYQLKKSEIRRLIVVVHKDLDIEFVEELAGDNCETEIFYPTIGLTLWFDNEVLIDTCIEKVS